MCGIVGYLGAKPAAPVLFEGLKRLEYRGYDSAGIALLTREKLFCFKQAGRVEALEIRFAQESEKNVSRVGIGHTRWATHGSPSACNAHPHVFQGFAIVHNGILENFSALKAACTARGEEFSSQTDSEVIAHLLYENDCGDFIETLKKTADLLCGSYAIAAISEKYPGEIVVARRKSPLILGRGEDGLYLASDAPALALKAKEIYPLEDGQFARLKQDGEIQFFGANGKQIEVSPRPLTLFEENVQKGGFAHFMQKEMHEIPAAVEQTLQKCESDFGFSRICEVLCLTEYVQFVGCGTAYHSGIAAKNAVETLARIPAAAYVSSEYRYGEPVVPRHTLFVAVSQSGETADTIAAAQLAKSKGAYVLAIVNAPYCTLKEVADFTLLTGAGREVAVAATKTFQAQLTAEFFLAVFLARAKGRRVDCVSHLRNLPELCGKALRSAQEMKAFAPVFSKAKSVYFIGRGADFCAALEGSLKLKEISYLPSEGYPAGELKHGTLALIEAGTPVVAVLTQRSLAEKTMNAVFEVSARGGKTLLVTPFCDYAEKKELLGSVLIPKCFGLFSPILSVIPLQALAYYTALERGNDPDRPRNLAKSVTVE